MSEAPVRREASRRQTRQIGMTASASAADCTVSSSGTVGT